jgi:hypothetical protein
MDVILILIYGLNINSSMDVILILIYGRNINWILIYGRTAKRQIMTEAEKQIQQKLQGCTCPVTNRQTIKILDL